VESGSPSTARLRLRNLFGSGSAAAGATQVMGIAAAGPTTWVGSGGVIVASDGTEVPQQVWLGCSRGVASDEGGGGVVRCTSAGVLLLPAN
jgi:hypothetical protein